MHNNDDMPANPDISSRRRVSPWRIGVVCCTLLGLLWAAQMYLMYAVFYPTPIPLLHALGFGMFNWYLWGAFAVLVARLARRFPLGRGRWVASLAIHGLCATLVSGAYVTTTGTMWWAFKPEDGQESTWLSVYVLEVVFWLPWNMLTYGAILGVICAFEYQRAYRDRAA